MGPILVGIKLDANVADNFAGISLIIVQCVGLVIHHDPCSPLSPKVSGT